MTAPRLTVPVELDRDTARSAARAELAEPAYAAARPGPVRRDATAAARSLFAGRARTAAEHRSAADEHAAAGRWADAVRERTRALIRGLEERGLLDARPGRTASEAAAQAGAALPTEAEALRAAAGLFDEIWYGGRAATPDADRHLREVEQRVRGARPTAAALRSR